MCFISTCSLTLSFCLSSVQIVLPSLNTVIVSAISRTSLSLCDIRMQVTPLVFKFRIISRRFWQSFSFNAAVGSSSIKSLAFLYKALAISTNCCCPIPSSFILVVGFILKRTISSKEVVILIIS